MSGPTPASTSASLPPGSTAHNSAHAEAAKLRSGVIYGLLAYGMWGLAPLYFKAVTAIAPSGEVLAHRIVWSVILLAGLMTVTRQWGVAMSALRDRRTVITLLGSTILVAANWYAYIYATATDRVVEASLGYFINPLINVLLGYVFLGERLRPVQRWSVLLAACGVVAMTVGRGVLPSIALFVAGTFGLYGLLRKKVGVGALVGLTVETSLLTPLSIGYLIYLASTSAGHFAVVQHKADVLLAVSGFVTSIPLLCFAGAARRLRLATLGLLQYIAPSVQLALGVLVYGEPFTSIHVVSFALIWSGLVIYSIDAVASARPRGPRADMLRV